MRYGKLFYRLFILDEFYRSMMRYHFKKEEAYSYDDNSGRYWYHHYKRKYWNELLNLNNEQIEKLRFTFTC